jgi:SAM-dependent methyltransferase
VAHSFSFDAAYYRRYYEDPKTRVYDRARHAHLIEGVMGLLAWFGWPVQSVLDVGAGVGWWKRWLARHRRDVRYVGTELEASTCRRYGLRQADVRDLRLDETFDLVVCHGVLPYVDDAGLPRAIDNLAAMSHGFLYLEAITKQDLTGSVDTALTDTRVFHRPGSRYRALLERHFLQVGAGLWAKRDAGVVFYELEVPAPTRRAGRRTRSPSPRAGR